MVARARRLEPSSRSELEITDLNRGYLEDDLLEGRRLGRGVAWLDTGTHESLLDAANFIATIEQRQGLKIACLEEVALRLGYVDPAALAEHARAMPVSPYRDYVETVLAETR